MKKATRNFSIFTVALLVFTMAFSTVTLANDDKNNHATELKFVGNVENQPVFQLSLNNTEEDEYTISFRDEHGNILYTDKFKGTNLTKKFMLKTEDFGDSSLSVIVKAKKANSVEIYSISRSHSYVEETSVNKVK